MFNKGRITDIALISKLIHKLTEYLKNAKCELTNQTLPIGKKYITKYTKQTLPNPSSCYLYVGKTLHEIYISESNKISEGLKVELFAEDIVKKAILLIERCEVKETGTNKHSDMLKRAVVKVLYEEGTNMFDAEAKAKAKAKTTTTTVGLQVFEIPDLNNSILRLNIE